MIIVYFDGDNFTDIIIGANAARNEMVKIFLNQGADKASFEPIDLPGSEGASSTVLLVNDMNGDSVFEIISAQRDIGVIVNFYSSCPQGGTQPYFCSWCFRYPNYMGRPLFLDNELPTCFECLPDYLQEQGMVE